MLYAKLLQAALEGLEKNEGKSDMGAIAFDTYAFVKKLEKSGFQRGTGRSTLRSSQGSAGGTPRRVGY